MTLSKRSRRAGVAKFLKSLYQILQTESPDIIRWGEDGKSIVILDIERMESTILPKYFKHSKYASFQRQLNYFGFGKWTKTKTETCTFSHPHFTRDNPQLHLILRKNHPNKPGSRPHTGRVNFSPSLRYLCPQIPMQVNTFPKLAPYTTMGSCTRDQQHPGVLHGMPKVEPASTKPQAQPSSPIENLPETSEEKLGPLPCIKEFDLVSELETDTHFVDSFLAESVLISPLDNPLKSSLEPIDLNKVTFSALF